MLRPAGNDMQRHVIGLIVNASNKKKGRTIDRPARLNSR